MAEQRVPRRLAAILAADVVGYSHLVEQDEAGTLAMLKARRKAVLEPLVAQHRGRIFKVTGDGVLVEFASAVHAVQCAIDLQRGIAAANAGVSEDRRIVLRVGVNLGDVILEDRDLYGDGVNIASRLEAIAEPGGVLISGTTYYHVKNKVDSDFQDLGVRSLKNISEPVRVYRVTGTPRVSVAAAKVISNKPSVAVLPLTNTSGDPEQEYFADGVTEDIITGLSRFHELFVIAPGSSFAFKGQATSVGEIGAELGVRYVVQGSVRKLVDRVRLTVHLLDANDSRQLWAERYEREDIFAVQDAVTQAIVARVMGRVIETAHDRALHTSPERLLAYDCWLRGQHQLLLWTRDGDLEALTWFERALEKEPHFARAHSSIALLLNARTLTAPGYPEESVDRSRALRHARLSVEYDNEDARSHLSLAWVSLWLADHARARRHFQLAEDLNINAADNIMNCACATACLGDTAKAKLLAEQARKLNPFHADWYYYVLTQIHFLGGDYREAFDAGHPYINGFQELAGWTTAALGILGREDEARAEGRRFLHIVEGAWAGETPMQTEDAVAWFLSVNHFLHNDDKQLLL